MPSEPVFSTDFSDNITHGNTLGALQFGTSIGALLFGIVSVQLYYYWEHHAVDGTIAKIAVCFNVFHLYIS